MEGTEINWKKTSIFDKINSYKRTVRQKEKIKKAFN